MATFTALQIVNRIHLRMGGAELADLTTQRAKLLLILANEAKDVVLESRSWDFDARHDGVLITRAKQTSATTLVTAGSASFTGSVFTAIGNHVGRIVVTEDATQGDTAYRILSTHPSTGAGTLDTAWLGTTHSSTADSYTFFAEYKLPDTVKDVLSVRFQDDDLSMTIVGREESFHSVVPRMHDSISDDPEFVAVGSQVTPTYDSTGDASTPGLGMLIHPTPLSSYRLDYSYTVRHPAISTSQGLENVPDYIVHEIVLEATAMAFATSLGNDPDLARLNRQFGEVRQSRMFAANKADPLRRNVLRSLDAKGGGGSADRPANDDIFHSG